MDTRWKGRGSQGRCRSEGRNLAGRENGGGWWRFEKVTVGEVKRVPQSGRTGWDGVCSSPRIGQRFPNAIEGRGNSSSRVVQRGGGGGGEEGRGCGIGPGMEIDDQRTIVRTRR